MIARLVRCTVQPQLQHNQHSISISQVTVHHHQHHDWLHGGFHALERDRLWLGRAAAANAPHLTAAYDLCVTRNLHHYAECPPHIYRACGQGRVEATESCLLTCKRPYIYIYIYKRADGARNTPALWLVRNNSNTQLSRRDAAVTSHKMSLFLLPSTAPAEPSIALYTSTILQP